MCGWFCLSVSIHLVVLHNLHCLDGALHQAVVGYHGLLGGVVVSEVPHEADTIANCVKSSCKQKFGSAQKLFKGDPM